MGINQKKDQHNNKSGTAITGTREKRKKKEKKETLHNDSVATDSATLRKGAKQAGKNREEGPTKPPSRRDVAFASVMVLLIIKEVSSALNRQKDVRRSVPKLWRWSDRDTKGKLGAKEEVEKREDEHSYDGDCWPNVEPCDKGVAGFRVVGF